ncbi:hypothetical protein ASPBRDRAFT_127337 [Aspergillus brasiliensis CBS 101740]|uniref:FAD-binding PCMH-type domain-containing protein n=1 Tax=Aspergillus brasiliensis (strain CBS 101740 / IMI 381727 / IBT 21946) TaxID=767769 RepID=A0A1L9UHC7_ASPBC|nr:hypothetical protein ASPBRDRAFT_127337 [Aspergillus brasiliensis CBS 101740]
MTVFLLRSALKAIFPEECVITPGQPAYKIHNNSYSSATESDFEPACIFRPRGTDDVSRFMSIVKPFTDREEIRFAIRSGGQQTTHACANLDNGITVDLNLLRGVKLHEGIVSIGAGERWGRVYEVLANHGLAVTGPLSTESGIGGVVLGGGISLFSFREGFVCDNVLNFEVVLANGEIVNANATTNSDLWMALRGGGNNFGIVTRYDMRTFSQGSIFGGSVWYECCGFPTQIEKLVDTLQRSQYMSDMYLRTTMVYQRKWGYLCENKLYYTRDGAVPKAMQPFLDMAYEVKKYRHVCMMSVRDAVGSAQQGRRRRDPGVEMEDQKQKRCACMNTTVKADTGTLLRAFSEFFAVVDPVRFAQGLRISMSFQPYPVSLMRKSKELGGNLLGLHRRDGPLVGILLLAYWDNEEEDAVVLESMTLILGRIEDEAVRRGTGSRFKLMNYSSDFQDPIGSYGPRTKQWLQQVSRKYDPSGTFQKAVPGGFKLMDHHWGGGEPYFQLPFLAQQ